jgi:hypothetical protein
MYVIRLRLVSAMGVSYLLLALDSLVCVEFNAIQQYRRDTMKALVAAILAASISCGVAQAQTTGTTGMNRTDTTNTTSDRGGFPWGLLGLLGLAGLYPLFDKRRTSTTTTDRTL